MKGISITTDILSKNGDFLLSDVSEQNISLLLASFPGDFKQSPTAGVGIVRYIDAPINPANRTKLQRKIALQLEADGASQSEVLVNSTGQVTINASYK
jgi:phage baseplate assembly protein W